MRYSAPMRAMNGLMLCALLLGTAEAFAAGPLSVRTNDGLALSFDDRGALQSVSVAASPLPVAGQGGFFVSEVLPSQTPLSANAPTRAGVQLVGTATQTGANEVTVNGSSSELGVHFTGVIRGGAAIHLDGTLTNDRGGDRAFVLDFRVPVNAKGWVWSSELETARALSDSGRVEDSFSWFRNYRTPTSASPIATIHDGATGLALALPPSSSAIYRLSYEPAWGLQLEWELGTAPDPQRFPNSASVEALLYRVDPNWAFRSALKRMYLLYPQLWTKRAKDGSWYLDEGQLQSISNPEDFALRFAETNNWANDYTRSHGIYALKYTEPWDDHLETSPTGLASWAVDSVDNLGSPLIGKGAPKLLEGQAALLSGVEDRDGEYGGYNDPGDFTDPEGTSRYVLNPDWEIPNWLHFTAASTELGRVMNRGQLVEAYELFREWGVAPKSESDVYDGLYFDSANSTGQGWAGWHLFNFRREHFGTTRAPLVFDPQSGRVALSQALSSVESLKHLSDLIHERGGLVMANSLPDPFVYTTGAYCDFASPGEGYSGDLSVLRQMRSALYDKPMAYLYNSEVTSQQFQHALLYALFPGGAGLENNRAVYQQWTPILLDVASAGWEPLTYATSSDPGVLVERYGRLDRGTLRFVAHRESGNGTSATLVLDKAALGIGAGVQLSAHSRIDDRALNMSDKGLTLEIPLSLAQEESAVVALSVVSGTPGETLGEVLPTESNPESTEPSSPVQQHEGVTPTTGAPSAPAASSALPKVSGKTGCQGCTQGGAMGGALACLALGLLARRRRAVR